MAVQYDPKVIQEFAENLNEKAGAIIIMSVIRWGLLFCVIGGFLGMFLSGSRWDFNTNYIILGVFLGLPLEVYLGRFWETPRRSSSGSRLSMPSASCRSRKTLGTVNRRKALLLQSRNPLSLHHKANWRYYAGVLKSRIVSGSFV